MSQGATPFADGPTAFVTTHWTIVLQARDDPSGAGIAALDRLCRTYWRPLYFFARRKGHSAHDAEDLVQGFFAKLLAKDYLRSTEGWSGRFRAFLITAFSHFMANEWDHARRLKRGGRIQFLPLDCDAAERRYALDPAEASTPAILFDRQWAETLMERVTDRLRNEYVEAGEGDRFAALRGTLAGEPVGTTYVELGRRLGISEGGVKTVVRRLRLRFAALVREEIRETLADPADTDTEMRCLLAALAGE